MEIDVRELIKAKEELELYRDNLDEVLKLAINEASLRLFRSVIKLTPTDSGWLQENWNIGAIKKNGDFYEVSIDNPVEYAKYVEYGHRLVNKNKETVGWVEGFFMLTISEVRVEKQIDNIVKRNLKRVEPKL